MKENFWGTWSNAEGAAGTSSTHRLLPAGENYLMYSSCLNDGEGQKPLLTKNKAAESLTELSWTVQPKVL